MLASDNLFSFRLLYGFVTNSSGEPIKDARITIPEGAELTMFGTGEYLFFFDEVRAYTFTIFAEGYVSHTETISLSNDTTTWLKHFPLVSL